MIYPEKSLKSQAKAFTAEKADEAEETVSKLKSQERQYFIPNGFQTRHNQAARVPLISSHRDKTPKGGL